MPVYDNFDDAFAAFSGMYPSIKSGMSWLDTLINNLAVAGSWTLARNYTVSALRQIRDVYTAHVSPGGYGANWSWSAHYTSTYYASQEGGGPPFELTMDKILEVMWDSDKLRWFHFINYIDSMRAGIWNTEIYETHLQDWLRHFSI